MSPSALETLHPDVYVVETAGQPRVIGVSVNTAGFVGVAEKGPIHRSALVTNRQQFYDTYGEFFKGSYLEPAVRYFFEQGGVRAYIVRVVGTGAAVGWDILKNSADSGGPGKVYGDPGPFNLDVGEHIDIDVTGYATQVFTFTGTQAFQAGNGFTGIGLNGTTLQLQFAGWDAREYTFSGLTSPASPTDVANFLNPLLQGGVCIVNGGEIDFKADQVGSGSFIDITGGDALPLLGFNVYKTWGTGNVPNIDIVTATDAASALGSLQGAAPIAGPNGELQIVTEERGTLVSIQILASTTALAFGYDNDIHTGWGSSGTSAQIISGYVEPFNLEPGEVLSVSITGGAPQNFTYTGTQAVLNGSGFTGTALDGLSLEIKFAGYDVATVTFSGMGATANLQQVINYLNPRIRGGSVGDNGSGQLQFICDQFGNGSKIDILGGTGLTPLGLVIGGSLGSGNVANVDSVTAQEAIDVINATMTDGVAQVTTNGGILVLTDATGDSATIQVSDAGTTATGFGFDYYLHRGSDADYMDSILVRALNPGAWGNNLSVRILTWAHEIREELSNTQTVINVSSVRGVSLGDVIYTYDPSFPSKRYVGLIWQIDVDDRNIHVYPMVSDMIGIIPSGSPIYSCSEHRVSARTLKDLKNGDTEVTISNTFDLKVGTQMVITDGITIADFPVKAVNGNTVTFDALSLTATIPAGAQATSQEFRAYILEKSVIKEVHNYLSMMPDSSDYYGLRLFGDTNESKLVEWVDLFAAPTYPWRILPLPSISESLAYGQDGSTPTDDDYIGWPINPRKGMYVFDEVQDLNFFAIPGITTVSVQVEMITYCENRETVMCILDAPKHKDEPTEIYNYRMFELNADSSYAAMYYPWIVVRDPVVGGSRVAVPPSGHIAGEYARTGATRGVHVAPANVVVRGALDLTYRVTDGEQDILNPVGINCIRWFAGEGIRIWGARTLANLKDGRHYVNVRRLLNFVKESIKRGNRWAVFQPNDPRLWDQIEDVNKEFLHSLWLRGMLFPSNDEASAFFVKCDAETNPISEIKEGRVHTEIGINPPYPAEFCIFRIGIWDGGSSIEEEIARRG